MKNTQDAYHELTTQIRRGDYTDFLFNKLKKQPLGYQFEKKALNLGHELENERRQRQPSDRSMRSKAVLTKFDK